jgi:hypothetical protein
MSARDLLRDISILQNENGKLEARIAELEALATDILDFSEEGWAYASPYFTDKWESQRKIEEFRGKLEKPPEAE